MAGRQREQTLYETKNKSSHFGHCRGIILLSKFAPPCASLFLTAYSVPKSARKFGRAMQILNRYHYSFFRN